MYPPVDTKDSSRVEAEVQERYSSIYPLADPGFVEKAFGWARTCFGGEYPGYQAIDARYHDFEHTMQGTLCMVRLLHGRNEAGVPPPLSQRAFELGLLAILLHDTGYLKRDDDRDGTGAKYTLVHVLRSMDFAGQLLTAHGLSEREIQAVKNMIRCTGVNVDLRSIPFQDEVESTVGFALGTADLLGQMAADDYVDKLPILYAEFDEADRFNNRPNVRPPFASAEDLVSKTPMFWAKYVVPKIEEDFQGSFRFLAQPYPDGPNEYLDRIEANISRLKRQMPTIQPG